MNGSSILLIIAAVFAIISTFCFVRRNSLLKEIESEFKMNPHFETPNNDGDELTLRIINGFGKCFQGKFRKANIGEYKTHVTYHCIVLLFLIFPRTAYRVIPTTGKWDTRPSWRIIGSDIEDSREKSCIKYRFYGVWSCVIAIFGAFMGFHLIAVS